MQPHRGTTVLVLGILGLVLCQICGIVAWVMANKDLAEMAAGRMDREGEGTTKAGKICGIISVILMILTVIFIVLFLALGMGAAILESQGAGAL